MMKEWKALPWSWRLGVIGAWLVSMSIMLSITRVVSWLFDLPVSEPATVFDLHWILEVVVFLVVLMAAHRMLDYFSGWMSRRHAVRMAVLNKRHAKLMQEHAEIEQERKDNSEEHKKIMAAIATYKHRKIPRA